MTLFGWSLHDFVLMLIQYPWRIYNQCQLCFGILLLMIPLPDMVDELSSDEDVSGGEMDEWQRTNMDRELKGKLLGRYSGFIRGLKHEFSKKKKKGKLPKEARQILLDWWNLHYKWPYPTVNTLL